jgi:hypothetical protein
MTIETLVGAAAKNDAASIMLLLSQLVAGYKPKYLEKNGSGDPERNSVFIPIANSNILANTEPQGV